MLDALPHTLICSPIPPTILPNLQMWIAGVILLGTVESLTWYLDYLRFNGGGSRDIT